MFSQPVNGTRGVRVGQADGRAAMDKDCHGKVITRYPMNTRYYRSEMPTSERQVKSQSRFLPDVPINRNRLDDLRPLSLFLRGPARTCQHRLDITTILGFNSAEAEVREHA